MIKSPSKGKGKKGDKNAQMAAHSFGYTGIRKTAGDDQAFIKLSEAENAIKTGEKWKSLDDLKKALEGQG